MKGKTMQEIHVGDVASFTKTISESDVYLFAGISGDMNPAHLNQEYAKGTMFKKRIAHGVLSLGLVSAVLGNQVPGPGAIYLKQEVKFLAPVYFGDTITAQIEVVEKMEERNRIRVRTWCTNQDATVVLDGEAMVMPPK